MNVGIDIKELHAGKVSHTVNVVRESLNESLSELLKVLRYTYPRCDNNILGTQLGPSTLPRPTWRGTGASSRASPPPAS